MLCLTVALYSLPLLVSSQTVVNGQIFTAGLAIVDAPALNSVYHGGSNMPIAIDISGNGQLQAASSKPGSDDDTRFDWLELYLVSSDHGLNLTVSSGPGFLKQEPGSIVKHLDFMLPSCIPLGTTTPRPHLPVPLQFTAYEGSHIQSKPYYSITALPLKVENAALSGQCSGNSLETQPQVPLAPDHSPWLSENGTVVTYPASGTGRRTGTDTVLQLSMAALIGSVVSLL